MRALEPIRSSISTTASKTRRTSVDLEVVIPAYNEAGRLGSTLQETAEFLAMQPWRSRIVVVDNGSADSTAGVARAATSFGEVSIAVIGCSSPGKGAAVRRGIMTSSARYVGFVDADRSTPIDTLTEAMVHLEQGVTAVIGSRYAPGAMLVRPQNFVRRAGGSAFRTLSRRLVPGVHDTQCGFKFFERKAAQAALSRCSVSGFAFDMELLRRVVANGGTVVELAVRWTDDRASTFRPLRDGVPAFMAALRLIEAAG